MHHVLFQSIDLLNGISEPNKVKREHRYLQRMTRQASLRCNHGLDSTLPKLVLRNALAQTLLSIFHRMDDFLFLMFCALVIGFLLPHIEDNMLQEIEDMKKELEYDLQEVTRRYIEVSAFR